MLRDAGVRVGPNQSATKVQWLLDQLDDRARPPICASVPSTRGSRGRSRMGELHVTDATNAAVTGSRTATRPAGTTRCSPRWVSRTRCCPQSSTPPGLAGVANALPGAPPITALVGDQQASLWGRVAFGAATRKITFGTGGMLDVVLDGSPPRHAQRNVHGTFPIVAWRHNGRCVWGIEAVMLAAGTNVQWLRDEFGIIASSDESHDAGRRLHRQRRRLVRPCAARTWDASVGLRRPRHARSD